MKFTASMTLLAVGTCLSLGQGSLIYEGTLGTGLNPVKIKFQCKENKDGMWLAWSSENDGEEVLIRDNKVFFARTQYLPFLSRRVFVREGTKFSGFMHCPLILAERFKIAPVKKDASGMAVFLPSMRFGGGDAYNLVSTKVQTTDEGTTYSIKDPTSAISCEARQSNFSKLDGVDIPGNSEETYVIDGGSTFYDWHLVEVKPEATVPTTEAFLSTGWNEKDYRTKTVVQQTKEDLTYAFDFIPSGGNYAAQANEAFLDAKQVNGIRKNEFLKTVGLIVFATSIVSIGAFFKWRKVQK